jgi:hypothetical protein
MISRIDPFISDQLIDNFVNRASESTAAVHVQGQARSRFTAKFFDPHEDPLDLVDSNQIAIFVEEFFQRSEPGRVRIFSTSTARLQSFSSLGMSFMPRMTLVTAMMLGPLRHNPQDEGRPVSDSRDLGHKIRY